MFKLHITVSEDTDVAVELDRIDRLAKKHNLGGTKAMALMRNAEDILSDLKKQDAEAATYGINVAVKRNIRTEDYDIILELGPRKNKAEKNRLLSTLFGR